LARQPQPRIADRLPTLEEWQRILKHLERQEEENERLRKRTQELERQLEEALRAAKRQAAPFARQHRKENPRKPGRKPGAGYGKAHCRPKPKQVDQTLRAPLPGQCPHCGGAVQKDQVVEQYQTELPPIRPVQRKFEIEVGHCQQCGQRVRGRHPEQTSDAGGVAGVTLGPQLVALAVVLNKSLGLSHEKVCGLLKLWGVAVSRSGICQAITRAAQKAEPTYQGLIQAVRASPQVTPDETGWKVAGRLWWLWAFATTSVTVYAILPGRGFVQAASVLGEDYAGQLVRDGWVVYLRFLKAVHQACLAHLLRRCREMREVAATSAQARFPAAVQKMLQHALPLRDRREQGQITAQGLAVACARLEKRCDRLLAPAYRHPANERLANHLWQHQDALFTFLRHPGTDATNWRAEQALRPLVVVRKVWGGNRTERGAQAQQILSSVLRTCWQQQRCPIQTLRQMLTARISEPLLLLPPASSQPGSLTKSTPPRRVAKR
jgi:transposase